MTFILRKGSACVSTVTGRPSRWLDGGSKLASAGPKAKACRWIEGEGKDKRFSCDEVPQEGSSYCPTHHRRCYVRRGETQ